jgi:hypothetical protein
MPRYDNNPAISIAKAVRETVNQDGAVLLDIEQGVCFSVNPVGTRIWQLLKHGSSLDEITDTLQEEFRLPRAQLRLDISDFLKRLEDLRLVGEQSSLPYKKGFFSRLLSGNRSA